MELTTTATTNQGKNSIIHNYYVNYHMNILICFCNMMVSTLHQVLCNSDTLQLCSQCTAHQFSPTPEVQMQMCSECTAYGELVLPVIS